VTLPVLPEVSLDWLLVLLAEAEVLLSDMLLSKPILWGIARVTLPMLGMFSKLLPAVVLLLLPVVAVSLSVVALAEVLLALPGIPPGLVILAGFHGAIEASAAI